MFDKRFPRRVLPTEEAVKAVQGFLTRTGKTWFLDIECPSRLSLKGGDEDCLSLRTPYQRLDVLRLHGFGLCMILDGRIQLAESDEWIYHELLIHPACVFHGDPRRVIVLGGGDGCAVRELLRYPHLTDITLVDIDEVVVKVFRDRFSSLNGGALQDPRVHLVCADALEYLRTQQEPYDLIVSDLTEPFDPSELGGNLSFHLYTPASYQLIRDRLTQNGIFVCQTGGILSQPEHDRFHLDILPGIRDHFPRVATGYEFVPSFGELWTITLASAGPLHLEPSQVDGALARLLVKGLRYYDGITHRRAFSPPLFVRAREA